MGENPSLWTYRRHGPPSVQRAGMSPQRRAVQSEERQSLSLAAQSVLMPVSGQTSQHS